jgi:hypothetical protein
MSETFKKMGIPTLVIATALMLMAPAILSTGAFAQNPHFIKDPTISKAISGTTATLLASGKVAGLGSDPTDVFLTTSGVTAETECVNRGGNNPPGQDATFGPTTGEVVTIQPRHGQITFNNVPLSITVTAEQAGCPDRMQPVITSATFFDVELHVIQGEEELVFDFGDVDP